MLTFRCGSVRHRGVRTRHFDRLIGVRVPEIKYGDIIMMDGAFEARRELKKPVDEQKIIEVITEDDVETEEVLMTPEDFEVQEGDRISWNQYWTTKDDREMKRIDLYWSSMRSQATWKNSNRKAPKQWARHKKLQHSYGVMTDEFLVSFLKFQADADAYDAYVEHCHAVWLARIDSLLTDEDFDAEDVDLDTGRQTKLNWVYRNAA
jgi:hypothetical protein